MKTKTLAAYMLAAMVTTLYSCDWFTKNKNPEKPVISGTWLLTKVSDSAVGMKKVNNLMLFTMRPDSVKITVTFNADSVALFSNASQHRTGSARYYVDSSFKNIFIKEDSTFHSYAIMSKSDSTLELIDDSLHLLFTKQQ